MFSAYFWGPQLILKLLFNTVAVCRQTSPLFRVIIELTYAVLLRYILSNSLNGDPNELPHKFQCQKCGI